tara:strand:- start:39 stop:326 length:288 start_codon:yes stop_codon:yes gene_type:complete
MNRAKMQVKTRESQVFQADWISNPKTELVLMISGLADFFRKQVCSRLAEWMVADFPVSGLFLQVWTRPVLTIFQDLPDWYLLPGFLPVSVRMSAI